MIPISCPDSTLFNPFRPCQSLPWRCQARWREPSTQWSLVVVSTFSYNSMKPIQITQLLNIHMTRCSVLRCIPLYGNVLQSQTLGAMMYCHFGHCQVNVVPSHSVD